MTDLAQMEKDLIAAVAVVLTWSYRELKAASAEGPHARELRASPDGGREGRVRRWPG